MSAPTGREEAEVRMVEMFLNKGHHRLAFLIVILKATRWPVAFGVGSIPLIEIGKAVWHHFL